MKQNQSKINSLTKNTEKLRQHIKEFIQQFEQMHPDELYKLNSSIINIESGKIPISGHISIYLDIEMLINFFLGKIIYLYNKNNPNNTKQLMKTIQNFYKNNIIDDISILIKTLNLNIQDLNSLDIKEPSIYIHSPFNNTFVILKELLKSIEPVWKTETFDVSKFVTLEINTHPYTFDQTIQKHLIQILKDSMSINDIKFINDSYYNIFFNKKYKVNFIYNIRQFLNYEQLQNQLSELNEQTFEYHKYGDCIFLCNSRNILTPDIIKNKYNNDINLVKKELQIFNAYMNIFTIFNLIDVQPMILDFNF